MMWDSGGYHRGGFFFPWLLGIFLVVLIFGKFLFPLLFLAFLAAPFIFFAKMHGGRHWHSGEYPKRKYGRFDVDEKPKRGSDDEPRYTQTASGEWVEIV